MENGQLTINNRRMDNLQWTIDNWTKIYKP